MYEHFDFDVNRQKFFQFQDKYIFEFFHNLTEKWKKANFLYLNKILNRFLLLFWVYHPHPLYLRKLRFIQGGKRPVQYKNVDMIRYDFCIQSWKSCLQMIFSANTILKTKTSFMNVILFFNIVNTNVLFSIQKNNNLKDFFCLFLNYQCFTDEIA